MTQSLGSGVIIDSKGYILTNAHVVDKASKIYVALADTNHELEAELIGEDNRIDLAVLKIVEKGKYSYLPPACSDDLMLGESVIAIGNPLGLGHSITTGIISSLRRWIQIDRHLSSVFIQTDALINPGNSGGPLININGELIGINTAIAKQAQGIGFSIPIDTAKRVLNDLINYGRVRRGFLGVVIGEVSPSFVRSYGEGGVLVEELLPRSPAEKAGLQEADVILAVDGIPVSSSDHYYSQIQTYTPDDSFDLTVLRGIRQLKKTVVLTALPEGYELTYTRRVFGFNLRQGKRGLVIDKVDGIEVKKMFDYRQTIEDRLGRRPLTFTVVRDNNGYLIELP
jgi:serine protease Do